MLTNPGINPAANTVAGGLYPGIFRLYKTESAAIHSVTMSRVPCPPALVPTSSLIRMITRRPFAGAFSRYCAARNIPSLIFVAPPTWNALICRAISLLSFVNGTRISASVENVNSATSSSGFSAANAVFAASRNGQEWPNRIAQIQYQRHIHRQLVAAENLYLLCHPIFA